MTTHLSSLTDAELLSEFRVKRDPLVTTPMEEELAARLEASLDATDYELVELKKESESLAAQLDEAAERSRVLENKLADIRDILNPWHN